MRTTKAAATDVANGENDHPIYYDALFRDVKNHVIDPPTFPAGVRFADTHTHLDMLHHPELVLARCAVHQVDYVVTVIDPTEEPEYTTGNLDGWLQEAARLAADFLGAAKPVTAPVVNILVGCHPHNASKYDAKLERVLLETLEDRRARAIGEIGLDYHYDYSPHDVQKQVYRRQLELAHEHNLPVSLHLREAHDDGLRILKEVGPPPAGTLLHCFNLDYATLEPFLELGCYVAFGGPLTFKKSDEVRDAARQTPLDRIVTETDAPFMAPHPVRGVTCGPEHVIYTAACLGEALGIPAAGNSFPTSDNPSVTNTFFASGDAGAKTIEGENASAEGGPGLDAGAEVDTRAAAFYNSIFQNALDFFEDKRAG